MPKHCITEKTYKKRKGSQGQAKGGQRRPKKGHGKAKEKQNGGQREAKGGHGAKGRPMEPKREPKGRQGEAKRGQGEAKRRPREAKGKPKEAKTEKEPSASPLLHHFGTQNQTKIDLKSLKNGFKNNAEYKYVFLLVLAPKHSQNPSQNHPKFIKNLMKKRPDFQPLF